MILIFGGAFQGKLDYAKETYGLSDGEIFDCAENDGSYWPSVDLNARVLNHFDRFVLACVREGIEAKEYLVSNVDALSDKIILADDVTQGVVPMNRDERAWREEVGRCLVYLGKHAEHVIRVYCGIPQVVK